MFCVAIIVKLHAYQITLDPLKWGHNGRNGVSNHQPRDCLLNRLFGRRQKTSKLRVTGLCAGNSPVSAEFPAQRTSNAEYVSIWWRHYVYNLKIPLKRNWHILKNIINCGHGNSILPLWDFEYDQRWDMERFVFRFLEQNTATDT